MKILVFTDLHGNYTALEELIKTEDFKTADKKIFLGDVCMGCSRPNECIEMLKSMDSVNIMGNNDYYVCDHIPQEEVLNSQPKKLIQMEYMKKLITKGNKETINSWQKEYYLKVGNKTIYFTHYPWKKIHDEFNVVDCLYNKTFRSRCKMFKDINADLIVFGHEHISRSFTKKGKTYYCVGTLGLGSKGSYIIINIENEQIKIDDKHIYFDINHEIDLMNKAGYPYSIGKIKK